jgi:hypothetical protein
MVVIRKNWQALPVAATTVTAPDLIQQPTALGSLSLDRRDGPGSESLARRDNPGSLSLARRDGPIQQPTADIVELNEINHDEPNEPVANTYQNSSHPPLVRPKKKLWIIEQRGLLDQFSFSSSSLMVGGAVLASLVFIISAGKGTVKTRIGQDSLSGFY